MNDKVILLFTGAILLFLSCKDRTPSEVNIKPQSEVKNSEPEKIQDTIVIDYDDKLWEEMTEEDGVMLDLRYATENNFTNSQIYPCGRCFLRPILARKMKLLQKDIAIKYGWRLKFFDCYRPKPAQQKLWDIVPDARYVTKPSKGSMHNRGLAVDVTIVDGDGKELDMGTEYDFFGPEAHTTNTNLPQEVLKNRKILTKLMEAHGLKGIRTEWWHFSLKTEKAALSDWEWPCQ